MVDFSVLPRKVAEAYAIKQQIKALEERYNDVLDSLGDLDIRNYPAGDFVLEVTETKRFNDAEARRNLTPEQFQSILKPKPDSALAKALLGDDYALTQKVYGQTRTIKRVEDA